VLVNLTVECLAKDDFILEGFVCRYMGFVAIVEPKVQAIEKVKASQVDDCRFIRALLCTKENRGGKDTLESLDHAVIMRLAWISAAGQVFGDGENCLNVRKPEEASFAVAGHFGVFASLETPADCVGMDSQERAEIPRPIVVFLGESKPVTLDGQVFCVWILEGYLDFA
jgi:hypothetical protein